MSRAEMGPGPCMKPLTSASSSSWGAGAARREGLPEGTPASPPSAPRGSGRGGAAQGSPGVPPPGGVSTELQASCAHRGRSAAESSQIARRPACPSGPEAPTCAQPSSRVRSARSVRLVGKPPSGAAVEPVGAGCPAAASHTESGGMPSLITKETRRPQAPAPVRRGPRRQGTMDSDAATADRPALATDSAARPIECLRAACLDRGELGCMGTVARTAAPTAITLASTQPEFEASAAAAGAASTSLTARRRAQPPTQANEVTPRGRTAAEGRAAEGGPGAAFTAAPRPPPPRPAEKRQRLPLLPRRCRRTCRLR